MVVGTSMFTVEDKRSGLILDTSENRANWTDCGLKAYKAIQAHNNK